MKPYPLSASEVNYPDPSLKSEKEFTNLQRIAEKIITFINNDLENRPNNIVKQYISFYVAKKIDEDPETVRDIIFGIDCGHNGVTIFKGNYERALGNIGMK